MTQPDLAIDVDPLEELYRLRELLVASRAWRDQAACRGEDTAHFYPKRGQDLHVPRAICNTCPVAEQCLEYALDAGEKYGLWGGTSERERRRLRALRRQGDAA